MTKFHELPVLRKRQLSKNLLQTELAWFVENLQKKEDVWNQWKENTKENDLKTLLKKYGGLNAESGILCRNCYTKLHNLDQRCRQFYDECQRNAVKMFSKIKRMSASPLSGTGKRTNLSKTPTKSRKTQLFNLFIVPHLRKTFGWIFPQVGFFWGLSHQSCTVYMYIHNKRAGSWDRKCSVVDRPNNAHWPLILHMYIFQASLFPDM